MSTPNVDLEDREVNLLLEAVYRRYGYPLDKIQQYTANYQQAGGKHCGCQVRKHEP